MKKIQWLGIVLAALGAGCADKLPIAPMPLLKPTVAVEVDWKLSLGETEEGFLVPLLHDHLLYVAGEKGELRAVDPETGKAKWDLNTGEFFAAGIGVGEHEILLGNKKGEVLAWLPTGQFLWRTSISSELLAAPQGADGIVVVRTAEGKVMGLSEAEGKVLWTQARPMPALVLRGVGGMTLGHGVALVSMPGGKLMSLNLSDGTIQWESLVSSPHGATELERMNDVLGDPLVGDGMVCTASYQGRAACLDSEHGQMVWSRDVDAVGPLVEAGSQLVLTTAKSDVMALDRSSGGVMWKMSDLEGRYLSPPTVTASYVVLGDAEGVVHFINRENGVEVGRIATDKTPIVQAPVYLGNERVLVVNRTGQMFALTAHATH
ncbi:outer membrane protein assembly factor BamB [Ferrovum sp.]|uniref:outer membrane protein assembly factor BamB n=1 Tax=Ferrovum sp. TaxID=2609467 RepID=UPI0026119E2E|nr:outer membrane protein assembly factor BamB [Ferrovum sp.]